jgi:hypothetical protein
MSAEIEPYRISVGDVLDDLELRLRNMRWPEAELLTSGQFGRGSTSRN